MHPIETKTLANNQTPADLQRTLFGRALTGIQKWSEKHLLALLFCLLIATSIPFLFVLDASVHGDVRLYFGVGEDIARGVMPYRNRQLEYPPYAIPIFLLPRIIGRELQTYQNAFAICVALMDGLLKSLLLIEGFKRNNGLKGAVPFILYCVTVPFIRYFYLQRYDIFPAVLTLSALLCFARGSFAWAGAMLAVAGGVKLYPALLLPPFWMLAVRCGGGKRFLTGAMLALVPLAGLSFFLPWWRFLGFHGERGLQVESLYASILWLCHLAGFTEVKWTFVKAWTEVKGPWATALVPWAKLLMLAATLGSVAYAAWIASKVSKLSIFQLARFALVPLLPFVAFNIVLSPQFLIWLLPLAALGLLAGEKWPMLFIAIGTAVIPLIYPSPQYGNGIDLMQTIVLVSRNLALVIAWLALLFEFWEVGTQPAQEAVENILEAK